MKISILQQLRGKCCSFPEHALRSVFDGSGLRLKLRSLLFLLCLVGSHGLATAPANAAAISAVWVNEGGDKVTRDELRASANPLATRNSVWDGERVRLFAAANEVVSLNLVIEAAREDAADVHVAISDLTNGKGRTLRSNPDRPTGRLFDWTSTEIELFKVGYLQIKGLSQLSYGTYDERHIPQRLQRPSDPEGSPIGGWADRPGADKFFPEIAVPIELVGTFAIAARSNQSVWADIYVPRELPAGLYRGEIVVSERGSPRPPIPLELTVLDFALPDDTTSRTMVATSYEEVARRYTGEQFPAARSNQDALVRLVMDRQFQMARRHRISLVDNNAGATHWALDRPRHEWTPRLTGKLFTAANGYAGPGEGVGSDVFAVGLYGAWRGWWGDADAGALQKHAAGWEDWFRRNFPAVDRFLYLADESENFVETESWARTVKDGAAGGAALPTFATANLVKSMEAMPSLSIFGSWVGVGDTPVWDQAVARLKQAGRRLFFYNGMRPASGSFAIEDDGVALRELPWGQYKKVIDRWFFWNATYYQNYQGGRGDTDVFSDAQTFGGAPVFDDVTGLTGANSSNGDGVLLYPGTDAIFPEQSYGLAGPIASLRLKHWRRGIQDIEYVALASSIDPIRTKSIVQRMVPKAMWEVGVDDPLDPTWVRAPISWSSNPEDWERARAELAKIIGSAMSRAGSPNK